MMSPDNSQEPQFLSIGIADESRDIAFVVRPAASENVGPALVWLGGYRSDMSGTKAIELDALAGRLGLACIRCLDRCVGRDVFIRHLRTPIRSRERHPPAP